MSVAGITRVKLLVLHGSGSAHTDLSRCDVSLLDPRHRRKHYGFPKLGWMEAVTALKHRLLSENSQPTHNH